jgi:hypothetical protein
VALVAVGVAVPHPWSELPRRFSGVPVNSRLPLGGLTVGRVGRIDRVVSDRSALAVPAAAGNDDLAGPAILRAASLERGTAQPVAVLENDIHRFPSRS